MDKDEQEHLARFDRDRLVEELREHLRKIHGVPADLRNMADMLAAHYEKHGDFNYVYLVRDRPGRYVRRRGG